MDCNICKNNGYLTGPGGETAVARLCDCRKDCPVCGGTGLITDRSTFPPRTSHCECKNLFRRIEGFNKAGIPSRMHSKSFNDFWATKPAQAEAKIAAMTFASDFEPGRRGILFWGKPGTGKTHLTCAIASYLILEKCHSVKFVDFFQLVSDIKAGFGEGRSESELISPLVTPELLIIDELGKCRATEWEISVLDQLVSRRYNAERTIVATTNLDPYKAGNSDGTPGLISKVDERIYSRLFELCDFIEVQGDDFRMVGKGR